MAVLPMPLSPARALMAGLAPLAARPLDMLPGRTSPWQRSASIPAGVWCAPSTPYSALPARLPGAIQW